jgi:hypothetical protein
VENNPDFKYSNYVIRNSKKGGAFNNLELVFNHDSGKYEYEIASYLIQLLICDYLDKHGCLHLVQPPYLVQLPRDYIRNPKYVQRDDEARKAKEKRDDDDRKEKKKRVDERQYSIIYAIKREMKEMCHKRFGFCLMSDHYTRFAPDLYQYGEYYMKRWHDDEVPLHEIQEEAKRLIDDALDKDPTLEFLETVGAVMGVSDTGDDTTDEEWSEYFARNPDLF